MNKFAIAAMMTGLMMSTFGVGCAGAGPTESEESSVEGAAQGTKLSPGRCPGLAKVAAKAGGSGVCSVADLELLDGQSEEDLCNSPEAQAARDAMAALGIPDYQPTFFRPAPDNTVYKCSGKGDVQAATDVLQAQD